MRRLSLLLLLLLSAACGKATRAQCTEMLDHYVDMTLSAEPSLADLPPDEARAAREMKKAMRRAEKGFAKVEAQCETEVSKSEYRCAVKAKTPDAWQACID